MSVASQPHGKQSGKQRQTKGINKPLQSPKTYHQLHVPSHPTGSASYYTNPTFRNSKITQPIAHNHQRNIKNR